jgi:predicted nucleic-acid-binding Zn-ribbon protein
VKRTGKCPKCESSEVAANAKAVDVGHLNIAYEMTVKAHESPVASFFKGAQGSTVSAWVCRSCGFIEFYADAPKNL